MILSKSDLQRYLELDRRALGIRRAKRPPLTGYRVWKFQVALRKHEYYANTGRSLFGRIMKKFWGAELESASPEESQKKPPRRGIRTKA